MQAKADEGRVIAEQVERGEVVYYPEAPFSLPRGDDLAFLLRQDLGKLVHKNISYNPHTGKAGGYARGGGDQGRLRDILAGFSRTATAWVAQTLPGYAAGWKVDRVSFRPLEEATRKLRTTARNDLLHVDAFPGRPARGRRILRVFANINPIDPRVWVTSEPLATLLARYRLRCEASAVHRWRRVGLAILDRLKPAEKRRAPSDLFMLRFHDYLKGNDDFQTRAPRRLWTFSPGSVWLAMTDGCSHAVLRGRYALEHSYFVAPQTLVRPDLSPEALLAVGEHRHRQAA